MDSDSCLQISWPLWAMPASQHSKKSICSIIISWQLCHLIPATDYSHWFWLCMDSSLYICPRRWKRAWNLGYTEEQIKKYCQNIAWWLTRLIFSNSKPHSNMLDEQMSRLTATIICVLTVMWNMHLLGQTELFVMNGSNRSRRVEMIKRTRWATKNIHLQPQQYCSLRL